MNCKEPTLKKLMQNANILEFGCGVRSFRQGHHVPLRIIIHPVPPGYTQFNNYFNKNIYRPSGWLCSLLNVKLQTSYARYYKRPDSQINIIQLEVG